MSVKHALAWLEAKDVTVIDLLYGWALTSSTAGMK